LDSCHSKAHVLSELEAYAPLVTEGSYIVATDGIMGALVGQERTEADWDWNNPEQAALDFAAAHDEFEIVEPTFPFNEGKIKERVTYWPHCFLLKKSCS
jgi:cephalosporin hydroxylase